MSKVYSPIKPYQTRLLRLHSDNDTPDAPLICDLYPADILHTKFEGLGVRAPLGEDDHIAEYEALSYAWGSPEKTKSITCNGVGFLLTVNPFQALQSLRFSRNATRYLWVDAICINQDDYDEKGVQVRHILQIYQKATKVIAWLGAAPEDLAHDLAAASLFSDHYKGKPSMDLDNFKSVYR
ncbi:heterokaryon incompatibility protein-domain-containing protein [Halenospora varia]|nr:heterokaryon incompatibility protein-domain-containing protein [Halenospora varia]